MREGRKGKREERREGWEVRKGTEGEKRREEKEEGEKEEGGICKFEHYSPQDHWAGRPIRCVAQLPACRAYLTCSPQSRT